MRRETLIRKLVTQLGESGYYVLLPTGMHSKSMRVCMPGCNVSPMGVARALDKSVLEALRAYTDNPIGTIPPDSMFSAGNKFDGVRIILPPER